MSARILPRFTLPRFFLTGSARDISKKCRSSYRIRGSTGEPLAPPPYGYIKSPDNPKKWVIDPEAAQIVRDIFKMALEGKSNETIARILQERKVLIPMAYWQEKGIRKGGKVTQPNKYKWCKTTVTKCKLNNPNHPINSAKIIEIWYNKCKENG